LRSSLFLDDTICSSGTVVTAQAVVVSERRRLKKMTEFLSVKEFLETYRISRTSTYRAVQSGKLRITKIGRSSRIAKVDAKAWADNLPTIGGGA
jgi:excisionase family DNA binding protein